MSEQLQQEAQEVIVDMNKLLPQTSWWHKLKGVEKKDMTYNKDVNVKEVMSVKIS